jgi:hypothetical protein
MPFSTVHRVLIAEHHPRTQSCDAVKQAYQMPVTKPGPEVKSCGNAALLNRQQPHHNAKVFY